jgi:hypothetical protein
MAGRGAKALPTPLRRLLGYSHHRRFKDHPRFIGSIQRGSKAWDHLYQARSSSERTNSYDP